MIPKKRNFNRLKEARFFTNKTQDELRIKTGMSCSLISRIEAGFVIPTDEQKRKIAKALDKDIDWLFPEKKES